MSAALIIVILVCGYLYINSHIPSKIQFKKSTGWHSYFQVALKGSIYLSISAGILLILWLITFITMTILNTPTYIFGFYKPFTYAYEILALKILGIQLPFVLLVVLTIAISIVETKQFEKKLKNDEERKKIFEQIAKQNPIENVLLESMNSKLNLLVSITLTSRKVYIGMVHEVRLEELDTDTIVIIPFLSGYRDKDTLSFVEEVNYADHYAEYGISFESKPLSFTQYRHVLPREQIESVSLFNADVYSNFRQKKNKRYRGVKGKNIT